MLEASNKNKTPCLVKDVAAASPLLPLRGEERIAPVKRGREHFHLFSPPCNKLGCFGQAKQVGLNRIIKRGI